MLILTGTFFIFIYREVVVLRRQQELLINGMSEYERSNGPALLEEFQRKVFEFAKSNPDFRPIYSRHFGTNVPATPLPRALPPEGITNTQ